VHGRTTARHTGRDFVAFLAEVVSLCLPRQQIHIILDNLSAHKTQLVRDFLQQHPRVQLHFTSTYSSWLNQVEIWFAKIEREVIARGIFSSVPDLARKLRRYINAYSANARPIQWKYSDPSRRLRTNEFTATVHLAGVQMISDLGPCFGTLYRRRLRIMMKETPSLPTTKTAGNLYPAGEAASVWFAISSVIRSSVLDKNTHAYSRIRFCPMTSTAQPRFGPRSTVLAVILKV
jgi:transposase